MIAHFAGKYNLFSKNIFHRTKKQTITMINKMEGLAYLLIFVEIRVDY